MSVPVWVWVAFNLIVLLMIIADLFILHRKDKVISVKRALYTSAVWMGLALIFNYCIYVYAGKEAALNFLTGFLIEQSLSVDNLFVFLLVFKYFQVPKEFQHKVLFWGILGAIVMRAIFIIFGLALVSAFHWVLYIFGAFLIYTGFKMAFSRDEELHPEKNPILIFLKKWIPVLHNYHDHQFFIKHEGRLWATPLFIVLLTIESTDLIFALDSIPAVMAITLDPFIIYTSNIFAILGLRSLYFALAGMITLFHFLHYGLAAILSFVGLKMLAEPFLDIPIGIALGFTVIVLTVSIGASLIYPLKESS